MGQLQATFFGFFGIGESPFLVAEKLALHQMLGNGPAVDDDKWTLTARTVGVNGLGGQSFAGPGLAGDQHGCVRGRHIPNQIEDLLHGQRLADHTFKTRALFILFSQVKVLADLGLMRDNLVDQDPELVGIEGFEQVVVGPVFHGLDGRGDRTVCGNHDNRHVGIVFLHRPKHLQPADALHFNVHQQDVETGLIELFQRLLTAGRCFDRVPVSCQPSGQRLAHDYFIIDDQNSGGPHRFLPQLDVRLW